MGDPIGAASLVGFRKAATNATWGFPDGTPVVCGANHGLWVDSLTISPDSQYLPSLGLTGSSEMRKGVKGAELVEATIGPIDMRYRGLETLLAMGLGSDTQSQIGSSLAYKHVLKPTASQVGLWGSAAWKDANSVTELPFFALNGFTITQENNAIAKCEFPGFSHGMFINSATASLVDVVAAVLPANGALTLVGGSPQTISPPAPIKLTITDGDASISALTAVILYEDADGQLFSETWTFVPGTLTYTTKRYVSSVISITLSNVTGAGVGDTISAGQTAGYNNLATAANITVPAEAETGGFAVFGAMSIQIVDQTGDISLASFEQYITSCTITANPGRVQQVTTPYGRRIAEPRANAHWEFTIGFNYDLAADARVREYLRKTHKAIKVEWTGANCDAGNPYRITAYLNDVAFTSGAKSLPGPGKIPLDIEGVAHEVSAAPTGFPSGYTNGLTLEVVNKLSASALA